MAGDSRGLSLGLALGAAVAAVPAFVPTGVGAPGPAGRDRTPGVVTASSVSTSTSSGSSFSRSASGLAGGAVIGLALSGIRQGAKQKQAKGASLRATNEIAEAKMPKLTEESFEEPDEDALAKMEQTRKKKAAKFDPAKQVGVCAPLGFFDPLGLAPVGKRNNFRNLRTMELKHGRVAMMASIGAVFQHFVHRPDLPEEPWETYVGTVSKYGLGAMAIFYGPPGFLQFTGLLFATFIMEFILWVDREDREPGDYGNPLGIPLNTEDMRLKELNNGRMAMIAISGILAAELATGKDAVEQLVFWQ